MRTISTTEARRYAFGAFKARVEVKDAGGTWRDLSTLPTFNAIASCEWREDVDSPGLTAVVTFWRNLDAISLSPLHDTSPLNRTTPFNPGGSFSALVTLWRRLRISWALVADERETPAAWTVAFDGLISNVNLDDDETISVECRGQYAELQDRIFEEEWVFAFGGSLQAGPFRIWAPSTTYALNEKVIPTDAKRNGRFYTVSTAGTSGTTEPTWPTGGTVSSGSAVFTYSNTTSPTGGYPVQQVIEELALSVIPATTAIFGDLGGTTIDLYVPTSPGWAINVFQVRRENVWQEMRALADQIGWDLRWKWSNADAQFRLTLYDPNRSKTVADRSFTFGDEVRGYDALAIDIADIRNAIGVVYSDAGDLDAAGFAKRKLRVRTDSTSIAAYGRRYMEVAESSASNVDSSTEADAMADAIKSDLAQPVADLGVRLRFFPWAELTDLYEFPPDGRRFTSPQKLAVTGYVHRVEGSTFETRLQVRGKPSTGNQRWQRYGTDANPLDNHRLQILNSGAALATTVVQTNRGAAAQVNETPVLRALPRELEWHVSASSGFTPSGSTLKGVGRQQQQVLAGLRPGSTRYLKTVPRTWNGERVVRGEPSEETSFTPGYVEPVDLNPETVPALLPPNGDFEGWFDGDAEPPDHWSPGTGTWADWARATTRANGAYSIEARNTGSSVRAELVSAWFPCSAGRAFLLGCSLQRLVSDGDVRLTVEWGDTAKASISTATLVQSTAGMTNFTPSRRLVVESPSGTVWARVKIGRDTSGTYQFRADSIFMRPIGGVVTAPTFSDANWADYGGGFTGVGYWIDEQGRVHLRGLAQTAAVRAAGAVIFTLPVGYRPAAQEIFAQTFGGAGAFMRVDVAANGNVVVQGAMAINDWVSLAGVSFDTR